MPIRIAHLRDDTVRLEVEFAEPDDLPLVGTAVELPVRDGAASWRLGWVTQIRWNGGGHYTMLVALDTGGGGTGP